MNDKILLILIERYSYTAQTSLGRMFFLYEKQFVTDPPQPIKVYFGNTLEDTVRPENIKVYGETALPGGLECDVSLFENDHYKKTIIFHTEPDKVTIKAGILKWVGCLAHGGQTHKDTAGCVIVAHSIIDKDTVQGSLKDDLRKFIEEKMNEGYKIKARFVNLNQLQ
jgi:hypothetical protein